MLPTHLRPQAATALGSSQWGAQKLPEMGAPPCRELQLKRSAAAAEAADTKKSTGEVRSEVCLGLVPVPAAQALPRRWYLKDEGC